MTNGPGHTPAGPQVRKDLPNKEMPPEWFSPLLVDFPDPVLVTNQSRRVVFMNCQAEKLFGGRLRLGDACPICTLASQVQISWEDYDWVARCLQKGESLNRVPISLKLPEGKDVPLTITATPVRSPGDQPAGCFIVLRDLQADLLAHPAAQLQTATLSSILEYFPTPFFTVNPELIITYINEPLEKLTGYRREEVVGRMKCGSILNTCLCNTEGCVLKQSMQRKIPISGLRQVVRDRQGREIPVVVSASIITDPGGRVIGGFEAFRDITALVEAEKKVLMLTELTKEGILMVDEKQQILFANSKAAELVKRPKNELIGDKLGKVLGPLHSKIARQLTSMVDKHIRREAQFCSSLDDPHTLRGRGRILETSMAVSQIGKNILTYIYLRDLSDSIRIKRELHKTNKFLQDIIQCSVDGIVVLDSKGVPLIFNEGAERILGYQATEVVGHPEVLHRFYPKKLATEMMRRMRSDKFGPPDKLQTTRMTFRAKDGEEVPVNFSAAIIRDRGREVGSVGIFSDLRDSLRMRQELEKTRSQLIQAEKIASLGRLAAGVAHEINNPLAGILIYAELLLRQMAESAPGRPNVEEIINQTLRCQKIVTRLLEFSRQSLGERTLFDPNSIIQRCVELVKHQAVFHNVKIVQQLDPELPQIIGDPGQLHQVFTNLLLNAVDAMGGLGRITITSQANSSRDGVILSFTDTGSGIPAHIKDKIFDPFFTTKPPGKGTGLGLAIVYGVIQRHGGTIEVASTPGGGTTFIMNLPLNSPEPTDPGQVMRGGDRETEKFCL
ncbi:MAG: PAS domain S-box protein [Desulfobacca sp.]|nr:PAS domain S-box protein [Desulfobacca sp.]